MERTISPHRWRLPARERLTSLRAARRYLPARRPPAWLLVAVGAAVLNWQINPFPVGVPGYDYSWITAMHVAAHMGLHWGSQIDYTYGPLGYLTIGNLFYDRTGIPADLVIAVLYVGLLAMIARAACRSLGLIVGALLVFVLARIAASPVDPVELLAPLVVGLGILALRRQGELRTVHVAAICALAAFTALDKLSSGPVGLVVVLTLAVVTAARPASSVRDRAVAGGTVLGFYVGALILLWLLAGQSLFDLPSYVRNGWDIINGYDSQALIDPTQRWQYKWVIVTAVIALALALWRDRRLPRMERAGIVVLWLLFLWVSFRHAYVREAPGKGVLYFGLAAMLAAGVLLGRGRNRVGLVGCLIPLAVAWHMGSWNVPNLFTVGTGQFVTNVNALLGSNGRHAAQGRAAEALRKSYGFTPALVARLTGQTVHFDPWEATIAYAYPQFRWDPAPIFQDYNAYTSRLDDINAAFLAGDRAPRYILRENQAPDQRDPRFESPRYVLTMMCRYQQVMLVGAWQLLERGSDRCGAPIAMGSERARFDQHISVPGPIRNSIVVASFTDVSEPLSAEIRGFLFRSQPVYFAANQTVYRFVTEHASNPHVMSFPSCLGWSPPYFDATPYRSLAIGHSPQLTIPGDSEPAWSYRVSFARIPFRCGS